jgi:copper(I)-binding protein
MKHKDEDNLMKNWFMLLLLLLLLTACSSPASSGEAALNVQDPWARPAKSGGNSAIYFNLQNTSEEDRLLEAKSDAAMMVEVHMTQTDASGNSMMKKQDAVPVGKGQTVKFEPGGLHVMLMKLKNDLEPGQKITFTLRFEKAGEIQAEAVVREP